MEALVYLLCLFAMVSLVFWMVSNDLGSLS